MNLDTYFEYLSFFTQSPCRLTFQVGDVLPARIRACVARPGLAKCGGEKPCRGRKPEHGFAEPEPPEQGGER